jgi:hypothetical protein
VTPPAAPAPKAAPTTNKHHAVAKKAPVHKKSAGQRTVKKKSHTDVRIDGTES